MRKIDLNNFQVATSETVRDINSRIMLNLVRRHQPVSRADLMRRSGLQRSTVSMITGRLLSERLLVEGALGDLPRGRKPTFLLLNPNHCGVIGVDVQPESTTVAVASMDGQLLAQESMPTARDPEEFIARLGRRCRDLVRAHPRPSYEGIGISLPGRIDEVSQHLIFAPTLGWTDLDLKAPLEKATGLKVSLENAANACALAELWSGRHMEGIRNLVAVTVSDGIDVGLVMNGQLVRGAGGLAGEFGHVTQAPDGFLCRCGNRGCWETLASNAAAVRYYGELTRVRKGEIGSKSNMASVPFSDLLRLVEQGDTLACKALDKMAHHLGNGIAMLVTGLAPDLLIVVGNIARVWHRVEPIVLRSIQTKSFTRARTKILAADPAEQLRLRGTVALVLQKHFGAPTFA
ncbi:ROK family protein [Verrucomicrobia bacterium]|nr:ROK family protein [Verrucomicrobiota bacterium]